MTPVCERPWEFWANASSPRRAVCELGLSLQFALFVFRFTNDTPVQWSGTAIYCCALDCCQPPPPKCTPTDGMQHQRFCTPTTGGQTHTLELERRLNVPPRQWIDTSGKFVSCSCLAAKLSIPDNSSAVERQELLWRQYFLDPTLWWDCRMDKKSARSPDFRHKESKEVPWLNNVYKPDWVDAQLAVLERRIGRSAQPTSNPLLHHNADSPTAPECQGYATAQAMTELCLNGKLSRAVDVLSDLADTQCRVSTSLLFTVIRRCGAEKNLVLGRRLDDLTVKLGHGSNAFLCNHILRMYACQGRLHEAVQVFKRVATPSAFLWFSIISAQTAHGRPSEAIHLYNAMRSSGLGPNSHIFVAALQACARAKDVESGRQVHTDVLESCMQHNSFVCNCLVDMYAKCGELEDARRVFDSMATRNAVTWNTMIAGYAKCGQLEDARKLFDSLATRDAVTWNAMINGYAEHGLSSEALTLYARMEQEGLILADGVTFACLLKACTSARTLQQGRQLHSEIVERGLLEGDIVLGNCLVKMYGICGQLEDARKVFDSLATRDVVTWTAMINGYAEHGLSPQALALYARMEQEGLMLADSVTYVCLLKACASAGALQQGRQLHSGIVERGLLEGDVVLGTCLVNMYAKCGQLEDARKVFDSLSTRDAVTWTAMINGYGTNNEGHKASACFDEMILAGIQPNDTTFTCLLVACSHARLVSKGRHYFDAMVKQHGLNPTAEHYNCMVDLLGRAGHLGEAEKMLLSAGCENDAVGLISLLNACKSHGDIERGTRCFESLLQLDPQNASAYVLMANMYADADRWADVDRMERLRKLAGASKKPAVASIEVNKQVHTFVVGEQRNDISCKVQSTNERLKEEGNHVPQTKLVLKPVSEKEKEDQLCGHAEKLALAFGLLNTPDGTPLVVTKNLRMCRDCHSSTEIMSRVEKRDIVIRDAYCVHRFKAGFCCCKGRD